MSYKKLYNTPEYTPIEISTDAEMASVLTDDNNLGKVYKFIGTSGTYTNGDLYETEINPLSIPLCFTANTAGSTIGMALEGTATRDVNFEYSTDRNTWNTFAVGSTNITLSNIGDKVYFRGNNPNGISESNNTYYKFIMTGSILASGNIMSLIDKTCNSLIIPCNYCFWLLFEDCSSLVTPPALPATTLMIYCYAYMFCGCTSLTTTPNLPAIELPSSCYFSMFEGCTSLYISDTTGTGYDKTFRIPTYGTFISDTLMNYMFSNCADTRTSDTLVVDPGQSCTYYTQNTPI